MGSQSQVQVDTVDPDEAVARLSAVYCPHRLTLEGSSRGFRARQTGGGLPDLRLYEVTYGSGDVVVDPVPFDEFVLVTRPLAGRFTVRSRAEGVVSTTRDALVMDAYGSYQLQWRDRCRVLHMVLSRAALERAAADFAGFDQGVNVRFSLGPPTSKAAGRAWESVTRFLRAQLTAPTDALGPLARAQLVRFAAAALLDAYPSSVRSTHSARTGSATPSTIRRAIAYIEQYAADPIGLNDIATAARLSPRGLQAAFQRYEGTSPLAYLRQTRMRRAHAELKAASQENTTVAAVAARWGFVNLGRFATEHRKQYGSSPREVLANVQRHAP